MGGLGLIEGTALPPAGFPFSGMEETEGFSPDSTVLFMEGFSLFLASTG